MKQKYYLIIAQHSQGTVTSMIAGKNKWEAMRNLKVGEKLDNFVPVRVKRIRAKLFFFVLALNKGSKNKELQK